MNPLLREDYSLVPSEPLSKDQNDGVNFLLSKFNAIVGYQAGFGKSRIGITAVLRCMEYSSKVYGLILCPRSAVLSFEKELDTHFKVKYSEISSDIYNINESRLMLCTYSRINKLVPILDTLSTMNIIVVLDEIHQLQNTKSTLGRTLQKLRPRFKAVFGMTATLLLNDIEGMYNVVNYVRPGFLGNIYQFRKNYLIQESKVIRRGGRKVRIWDTVGYKNLDPNNAVDNSVPLLSEKLKDVVIVRKRNYNIRFVYKKCGLSELQKKAYDEAASGILEDNYDKDNEKAWGARLHDLQRVVDGSHPKVLTSKLCPKEKLLVNTIKEVIDRGESCLVYTEYEDTVDRLIKLVKAIHRYVPYKHLYIIKGSVSQKKRRDVVDNLDKQDVVITTKAGCSSMNLQSSNNVIMYNVSFSVAYVIQLIGRIARMDTKYSVQRVYMLEVEGTIDTYKRMLIEDHALLIKSIFGAEPTLPVDLRKIDRKYMNRFKHQLLWNRR